MPRKPKIPDWAKYWRVDQCIECLPLGAPRKWTEPGYKAQSEKVERALLAAMPDAYESHADDPDGEAGRNEWPEADSHKSRKLARIWNKLDDETRAALIAAAKEEGIDQD